VVSQLNTKQSAEVEDINITSLEQEPYDRLTSELVRRLSTLREQRVRQLFSHEDLGDRKPSQVLRHLKGLALDVPDDFLRIIRASRLPTHVKAIIFGQTEGSLDSTSQHSDRICEVAPQITTASISPVPQDNTARLFERVEELSRQFASLRAPQTFNRSQHRERHRSQSSDR
jgi:hypothetical protein